MSCPDDDWLDGFVTGLLFTKEGWVVILGVLLVLWVCGVIG